MNLDHLPEVLAYLLSLVTAIDPGALALGTLGAGIAWRVIRRLRIDLRFPFALTRWMATRPVAIVLGPLALALDLACLIPALLAGIRLRRIPEVETRVSLARLDEVRALLARMEALEGRAIDATAARMTLAPCLDSLRGRIGNLEIRTYKIESDLVMTEGHFQSHESVLRQFKDDAGVTSGNAAEIRRRVEALEERMDLWGALHRGLPEAPARNTTAPIPECLTAEEVHVSGTEAERQEALRRQEEAACEPPNLPDGLKRALRRDAERLAPRAR